MQERTLLKISLISALLGIIGLFFVSQVAEVPEGVLLEDESQYVLKGSINKITELDSVTFLELKREDEVTVVLFKDYPVDLHKDEYVEVIGTAQESDGEVQLIGKEIRVIK